jgi:hypothetical protein
MTIPERGRVLFAHTRYLQFHQPYIKVPFIRYMTYVGFVFTLGIIASVSLIMTPAYGQAETETHTETIPLENVLLSGSCPNTEVIEASGTLKIITHTTLDANGGFHGKDQILNIGLSGIGQTTGDEYRITSSGGSSTFSSEDGSPVKSTLTGTSHITDGISQKGKITIQLTVNANGELKVDDVKFKLTCD